VLLLRERHRVNHKRLSGSTGRKKLTVRRRGGRKRAIGTKAPMAIPRWPQTIASLDFVSDLFLKRIQLTRGGEARSSFANRTLLVPRRPV